MDLSPKKSSDARNLLTAAGTAMLHPHMQVWTLGSNVTLRREAILGVSVLEQSDASLSGDNTSAHSIYSPARGESMLSAASL